MRVEIIKEETPTSCGRAKVSFPKNCSVPFIEIFYAQVLEHEPLQEGVTYGVREIYPPGDFTGVLSYVLVIEALQLLAEFLKGRDVPQFETAGA